MLGGLLAYQMLLSYEVYYSLETTHEFTFPLTPKPFSDVSFQAGKKLSQLSRLRKGLTRNNLPCSRVLCLPLCLSD